ncbi:MAG: helix-turn-helix transcriptional regulator [Alteromonadaceae bacterium]|nr:helix-turn-helix transcriptional regulator [Alteromonadaceae bacterium]
MQSLSLFFANFAFAQMLMCALFLLPMWRKNQAVRLFIMLMLVGSGYWLGAIFPQLANHSFLGWLQFIAGNALPGVFWLVGLSLFAEHFELKTKHYVIAALTLFIPLTSQFFQWAFTTPLVVGTWSYTLIKYGDMALELGLISHALFIALKYWRDDLVQERRYIRGGVISISALYIVVVIAVEQLFNIHWQGFDLIKSLLLAGLITAINLLIFTLRESSLFALVNTNKKDIATVVIKKPPSKDVEKIILSMTNEKLYQQDGLTIASLARHLCIHEYKLRQLINGELNYRNFNDFLNFYRIQEVTQELQNKNDGQLPILTLALESGFRSLSSFNKAFKNTHGMTPTEYRKQV